MFFTFIFITILSISMAQGQHNRPDKHYTTAEPSDECEEDNQGYNFSFYAREQSKKKSKPPIIPGYVCPAADIDRGCKCPKDCLYQNARNCHTFIQCTDSGLAYLMPCPRGTAWNDNEKICDAPEMSTCRRGTTGAATTNRVAGTAPTKKATSAATTKRVAIIE